MTDIEAKLQTIERQEALLQFREFTNDTALEIGLLLVEKARAEGKAIAIDITRNHHCLFHFAMEGTPPDYRYWIQGKRNVVDRFQRSSLYVALDLEKIGQTFEERHHASSLEYFNAGGSFPLTVRKVGVVGAFTLSGMPGEVDHAFLVDVLNRYLKVSL